jgi:hypothetical protein
MKLSLEIPKAHLKEMSELTDLDFALAHFVMNDKPYREFYAEQAKKRIVILDNGYYETNEPLPIPDLMEACRMISPSIVVAPDKLKEPEWTFKQWETMDRMFAQRSIRTRVGCNITGRNAAESVSMMASLASRGCSTIFLPFREDRLSWVGNAMNILKRFPWIHLLGVNTAEEIQAFAALEKDLDGRVRFSLDTAKPFKFAIADTKMPSKGSLRGGGKLNHDHVMMFNQKALAAWNIAVLRKLMTA